MQAKKIHIKRGSNAYIFFYTNYDPKDIQRADDFVKIIEDKIKFNSKIGYAGFSTKKSLQAQLKFLIFGKHHPKIQPSKFPRFLFKKDAIVNEIVSGLQNCLKKLPTKSSWIFLFPTFDSFVLKKMKGIGGFVPRKHVIFLTIHPQTKKWKEMFRAILAHEFNHSIRFRYFPFGSATTLLDSIIFEGLADNFSQQVTGRKPGPGATTLSLQDCRKIFPKIKKLLNSTNRKVYHSLFFEDKKYPLWTGYALGYQIVKNFLRNNPKLDWKEIMKLKSEEILEKSDF